tara:strand:+ start:4109 stop:4498 length:390 start_codon:yes stop_codon:yes gene_type:complete
MRKEIEDWYKQAEQDFSDAEYSFKGARYSLAAFLCQQSVEKALKALFLFRKKIELPKSHSLIYFAEQTKVPKHFLSFLGELTPSFVTTRYPDVAGDLPSKLYSKENTEPIIKKSREVLEWIKKQLSNHS